MVKYTAELVADGYTFPETPRWHAGRQAFYFVDLDRGRLFELKDGTPRLIYQAEDWLSGFAFDDEDGFFITQVNKRQILHLTGSLQGNPKVTHFADCSALSSNIINDMIRGPNGDLYVGAIVYDAIASFSRPVLKRRGPVIHVRPDGAATVGTNITFFPNGAVIPPGNDRYYVADSYDACIYGFDIAADGGLKNAEMVADLPGELPDGMSLDAEGGMWVASHHRCIRVLPGGEITDEVDTGATTASACMLGGEDGRTLLITGSDGHDRTKLHAVSSGVIMQAHVAVPGTGLPSIYDRRA